MASRTTDVAQLLLSIDASTELLRRSLNDATSSVDDFSRKSERSLLDLDKRVESIGKSIGASLKSGIGLAVGYFVGSGIKDAIAGSVEYASSLGETAQQLGITTKFLQEYRFAATQSGASVEQADKAIGKFTINLGKAREGSKDAVAAFANVGVTTKDLANGDSAAIFGKIADGIAKIPDPARQAADAVAIFGKGGQAIIPILEGGSAGLNAFADAAERAGLVLSDETINKLDMLADKGAAVKQVITTQLAAAIGENADAILALGSAAANAAGGVSTLLNFMRGFKQIAQTEGILSAIGSNDSRKVLAGTDSGMRSLLEQRVNQRYIDLQKAERARDGGGFIDSLTTGAQPNIAQKAKDLRQAEAALARYNVTNPVVPAAKAAPPPPAPDVKVDDVAVTKKTASGPKPVDRAAYLRDTPIGMSTEFNASLAETAKLVSQVGAEPLLETLKEAFSTDKLDEMIAALPNLSQGLDEARRVASDLVQDLSQGLAQAIVSGGNLGDVLIRTFQRAAASIIESGLLDLMSGGAKGVSFGASLSGVTKLLGFAEGGVPPSGRVSIVGENGPELIVGNGQARVIPMQKTPRILTGGNGGGGGDTYNDFRGTIMTEELYRRIDATGQRAAQAGAMGGAQMAAAQRARSARRSL
jgi:hypothetical protein